MGYWPFDNGANDESGNANNGTVHGATLTADRLGSPNSAYLFDGVDDYVDIGANSMLRSPLPVTIVGWVRFNATDRTRAQVFTNDYTDNIYTGVWISGDIAGHLAANIGDGAGVGPPYRRSKFGSTVLALGTWYHIGAVIRGPLDMDLYVNGIDDGGIYNGAGGPLVYGGGPGNIGRKDASSTGPPYYNSRAHDEIYFYNRALSAGEIRAIFDQRNAAIRVTARVRDPHDDSPYVDPPPNLQGASVRLITGEGEYGPVVTGADGRAAFSVNWNLAVGGHYEIQLSGPNYHVKVDWNRAPDEDPVAQMDVDVSVLDPLTEYLWPDEGGDYNRSPSLQAAYFVDKFRREFWLERFDHIWRRDLTRRVMSATMRQQPIEGGAVTSGTFAELLFSRGNQFTSVKSREASVVYHEYTHCVISDLFDQIHQQSLGRVLRRTKTDEGAAMDEAFADYFAAAFTEDPVIDRHSTYLFPTWWPLRDISRQPIRPYRSPWREECHSGSLILSGTLWSIRAPMAETFRLQFDDLVFRGLVRMIRSQAPSASFLLIDYFDALMAEAGGSGFETAIQQAFAEQNITRTPLPLIALEWSNDEAISNLVTTPDEIRFTWPALPGAGSYEVLVASTWYDPALSIGDYVTIATGLADTTYVFQGREPRTEYLFSVVAVDSAGYSGYRANPVLVEALDSTVVSVDERRQLGPPRGRWLFNTPNPFNPVTVIYFETVAPSDWVEIQVFSIRGQLIRSLGKHQFGSGRHSVIWNGIDAAGRRMPSGKYFVSLRGQTWRDHGNVILIR